MAKAQSPVRLEAGLMESAAIAGEVYKRSAAEQVEYWASIGRTVAPKITPEELLELKSGLIQLKFERNDNVTVNANALLAEIDQARDSGTLSKSIVSDQIRYQASIARPGYLEQVSPDGSVVVGMFENGEFIPL